MAQEQKRKLKRKPVFGEGVWLDDDLKVVERLGRNRRSTCTSASARA